MNGGPVMPMVQSNNSYINMTAFPGLGAYPYEIGAGTSPGGINTTASYPMGNPYYFQFGRGRRTSKRRSTHRQKSSRRSVTRKGRHVSKRGSRRRSSKRKSSKKKTACQRYLSKKIGININEFKKGMFKSRAQAIAVSYSQTKKKYPKCKV